MKPLETAVIESSVEGEAGREGGFGRAEKAAETCLFASDVVNADSP